MIVRVLRYNSDVDGYGGEPTNWKGQVQSPTLINKVTEFSPRTGAIMQKIREARTTEDRTILILSDRREHLAEFFRIIRAESAALGKVGYYVGGMK